MQLTAIIQKIATIMLERQLLLATAESCTGGGVAYFITAIPGSSKWFERGFITYSNQAKEEMLGVNPKLLAKHGAVSKEVAKAMAEGALLHSNAKVSLAITGIAGPDGDSIEKPIGTIWFSWAEVGKTCHVAKCQFSGDRKTIRNLAIKHALVELLTILNTNHFAK